MSGSARPPAGPDVAEGTWTGREDRAGTGELISLRPTPEQTQKWTMQSRVLWGVGATFFGTLLAVLAAVGLGWITQDFGSELARMILPSVLGSASTIIGVLFVAGKQEK
ncbi:hypothetical protein [Saccharothrix coeruleofusca]|uniref:Uncharacterized protein n=1 Tax=Saccharothrix coeruleofusca TaxID=33919 RepID=A0A918AUV6_9PSEU|nr:hypothetical protein [Saccharothrix coeruleofusca]MBP2338877.1 hypothetical protein [Saccharothrix coeruleofusca]GGP86956.1 hypothetical protein GCM10010185_70960 [Saccharothrix coeruleofusca]